jgi:glycosyltransferase involved in cell wall biosynthesis
MADTRVSVICAFHNGARFLAEAIESVLVQSFDAFELLLIDDGSTDESSAVARRYAEQAPDRIRCLEHPGGVNRGVSPSRNLGLRSARGEFVAFIDCDDVWHRHKLGEQVQLMTDDPRIGMLCGTVNYWSSWAAGTDRVVTTGRAGALLRPPEALLLLHPLGELHAPCPSDVMLRRTLVENGCTFDEGFSSKIEPYEDQAFFAKVYLMAPVFFSRRVWTNYRQHQESCVSIAVRTGLYGRRRREFLDWLAAYLQETPGPVTKALMRKLAVARWQTAHPRIGRLLRPIQRFTAASRA